MSKPNNRELLELAAKAAGIELRWHPDGTAYSDNRCSGYWGIWNPLKDDGDALRLAVKLGLVIDTDYNDGAAVGSAYLSMDQFHEYDHPLRFGADRAAATRRVIVLAAAEIGKAGRES